MIPGIPTSKLPIDTFNQQLNELFANMKAHQQQKIRREQLMQARKFHDDLIKFKMSAEKRANEDSARKQGLYGERLKKLKHENADDEYFDNAIGGGNESSMPNEGMRHEGATSQTEGINNPNTGILNGQHDVDMNGNPVGGGEPQQSAENVQGTQSESPVMKMIQDRARKDPKFRALYIKKYKVDPLASLPQTPEEKESSAIRVTNAGINERDRVAQEKENRKVTQDIEDTAKPLLAAAHHITEIEKLLKKHPNATGPLVGRFPNSPFSDSATISSLNTHAVPLQSKLAHELGARGGYGVSQLAESAKPSGKLSYEANIASVEANKDMIWDSFKQMKEDYERRNPTKTFPYKLPSSFYTEIITPNGKKVKMDPDQTEWALEHGGKRG